MRAAEAHSTPAVTVTLPLHERLPAGQWQPNVIGERPLESNAARVSPRGGGRAPSGWASLWEYRAAPEPPGVR